MPRRSMVRVSAIPSREHHVGIDEPRRGETVEVLAAGQGTGDAPDVGAALGPVCWGEVVLGDDVGDPDPTTRCEDPEHLGEHGGLSVDRLITQLEITTSTALSGSGMFSMVLAVDGGWMAR